ncbi:glycosyltransferase family 1 protein [Polymorphobacter fuscus]|uniref:Glycosyltransferase family 1 protein n=2 Tax=Sandarakinorhabdus fusca TaxID=1439888 RepID=A0A7C9KLM7_9SPHN|nr:glycosyltransferase [Polymorphobacter fuscus]KAB7648045.1 glycosyltransferase [Polymorphobacter fuscus]MQT17243.1 glycosyltransferase family 1 protein [Polymorphobacter fuscus]
MADAAMAASHAASLHRTRRGPLVLLFYDGFEWRARPGAIGGSLAQARRFARFAYRSARRRQVRTGFYTAFVALRTALERHGCDVRVNDFATAAAMPDYPIGLAGYPDVLDAVRLPNPVLFGPGDFGPPGDAVAVAAQERIRLLIQPSDWFADYYRPSCGDKMVTWFAGIDIDRWQPAPKASKSIDVLIYDKIRWHRDTQVPQVRDRLCAHLDARGLRYRILRYGEHHQGMFADGLRNARSLAFLCEHETQGLAYQEALAAGVPVFAWDEEEFVDPHLSRDAPAGLAVSSVPYFDGRCGRRFRVSELEPQFDLFWSQRASYRPRDYVRDALSLHRSAQAYLALYARAGARG